MKSKNSGSTIKVVIPNQVMEILVKESEAKNTNVRKMIKSILKGWAISMILLEIK